MDEALTCHAKKGPTFRMVSSVLCTVLRDLISAALITWAVKLAKFFLTCLSVSISL